MTRLVKNRIKGERARKRRADLIERQKGLCHWCKEPMLPVKVLGDGHPKALTATIEHVLALAEGGTHHVRNTVAAHFKCNQEREAIMRQRMKRGPSSDRDGQ